MKTSIQSLLAPLLMGCALLALSVTPAKAIVFIGGPAGTMGLAQGIGVGGGMTSTRAYAFITPQHFLFSHNGAPTQIEGIPVVASASTPLSQSVGLPFGTYGFGIGELATPIPGINPLPIIFSPFIADYLGLDLRVMGNNGNNYGTQQVQPNLITTLDDSANPPDQVNVPVIASINTYTDDLWLFVDVRPGTLPNDPGKAFLASGDSSGALIAELPGGQLGVIGTANGLLDEEAPLRTGTTSPPDDLVLAGTGLFTDIDMNFYNLVPNYINEIAAYVNGRNAINSTDYEVNVLLFGQAIIPEPTRALMLSLGLALILFRRRR